MMKPFCIFSKYIEFNIINLYTSYTKRNIMKKSDNKKNHKLDMFGKVLPALDKNNKQLYSELTDEERKAYSPLVLMRAMSILGDQNQYAGYQLLAVNNIVNTGFWGLYKHPELQHMLLCACGLGSKQYHPWLSTKTSNNKSDIVDKFLLELYPSCNNFEIEILRNNHTDITIEQLCFDAGKSDKEVKEIVDAFKKIK